MLLSLDYNVMRYHGASSLQVDNYVSSAFDQRRNSEKWRTPRGPLVLFAYYWPLLRIVKENTVSGF